MNSSSGILLIIVALLVLYAAITGKYAAFEHFFNELFTGKVAGDQASDPTSPTTNPVTAPTLQSEEQRIQGIIDAATQGTRWGWTPPYFPTTAPGVRIP